MMQLNFDEATYKRLCRIADYHGTTPAWLARRWVESQLELEEELIRYRHRAGSQGGVTDDKIPPRYEETPPTLNPHTRGME